MKLKLKADKITVRGPKIDGSLVISFELGEYQKANFAKLVELLDFNQIIDLTVEQDDASFEN